MELTSDQPAWVVLHEAVADAIRLITPKELCFRLGITAQYLSDAIHGKNSKGLRLEWLPIVVEMAPVDAVRAILRALGDIRGFEFQQRKVLTPEQENAAIKDALKRLAPGVLVLVEKELGR